MHRELDIYTSRIDRTIRDLEEIHLFTTRIGGLIAYADQALTTWEVFSRTNDKLQKGFFVADTALNVLALVSPLATPVNALNKGLDRAEKAHSRVDDQEKKISGKDNGTKIDKIQDGVANTGVAVGLVADAIKLRLLELEIASEAMGNFKPALQMALRDEVNWMERDAPWANQFDRLNRSVEEQLGRRNEDYSEIKDLYETVKAELTNFVSVLTRIDFERIYGGIVNFDRISALLDVLEGPLEFANSLIEPIKPLLNAVSFILSLIVDPVVDFIIDTLGLDGIIEDAERLMEALLPSVELLDAFNSLINPLDTFLGRYIDTQLGTSDLLKKVNLLFSDPSAPFDIVGVADLGPTGWSNNLSNTLEGDEGDDILDALDGDDSIFGGAGNDIIIAGEGSDTLNGGTGNDMFYFNASFTGYELARAPADPNSEPDRTAVNVSDIIITHVEDAGGLNTGEDTLRGLEDGDHVVFTDVSFTGRELKEARIGGSTLEGDDEDNLMFLNSNGRTVNGFHLAKGKDGDDRIFGSTQNDQLNGGAGNDIFLPGSGNDLVNGHSGRDTFQVLEGAGTRLTVNLLDRSSFGQGQDTLNSIENIVASPNEQHRIIGNDRANAIYTGDEIDVISGLAGNDTIKAGGDNDYIIGGRGSDVIYGGEAGGTGNIMISGSAAQRGVRDLYVGGEDRDFVSYTSTYNTIREIIGQPDDDAFMNVVSNFMQGLEDSGPVRIRADRERIERFDMKGNWVATDRTENVDGFMGSDQDDTIYGGVLAETLHGGGGNDTIWTGGTRNIDGGAGDDVINPERVEGGATTIYVDGGAGRDVLNLDNIGDARWYFEKRGGSVDRISGFLTSVEGDDLRNENRGLALFTVRARQQDSDIEVFNFGNYDDHLRFWPGGSQTVEFNLRGGDDRFDAENGFAEITAGAGNDIGNFTSGGGIFRGGSGDDFAVFDNTSRDNRALMGSGQDFLEIERFYGEAEGGRGYDRIVFDIAFDSRIVADLEAGTLKSFKLASGLNPVDQVDMKMRGFEEVVATEFNDLIDGTGSDEQFVGLGGNDTLRASGGDDKLFGGAGNDSLEGGWGDDLLHGGPGNDVLRGGPGRDAVSYAWVRPGTQEGALIAGNFGGVTVNLQALRATGVFGNDTLASIEDVIGSGGDDSLSGTNGDNLLSGGGGNDRLFGFAGDDVLVTGSGNDTASAGSGDDVIVVGTGRKELIGGSGFDVLDFGTVNGVVTIDFTARSYDASFVNKTPRWINRDPDGDGVNESDGVEARVFNGVAMTPQQVLEADPQFSDSNDDLARPLPDEFDPEFDKFLIETFNTNIGSLGTFSGVEKVVGGISGANIILTSNVDRFDGRVSNRDVIDLSNSALPITYDFRTGDNNVRVLVGDRVSGIEGLLAGVGNDSVWGNGENNILQGGDGRDRLVGGGGNDELRGGNDRDTIEGGSGNDKIYGGRGIDQLSGGSGHDRIFAGSENDQLYGVDGNDTINGETGNDTLRGQKGNDSLFGKEGNDRLIGGGGRDYLSGGSDKDSIEGGSGNDVMSGGPGVDSLSGGSGHDRILGGTNSDRLFGVDGNDTLNGQAGNDTLSGQRGNDTLFGKAGNDQLMGGGGNDEISGANGRDSIDGGSGNDRILGGSGSDRLAGGPGHDFIIAEGGNDLVLGGDGNDRLNGESGNDTIRGERGDDTIFGKDGDDLLIGGGGRDVLSGGLDDDTLTGGSGDDTFTFIRGRDVITDFQVSNAEDRIDLSFAIGITSLNDLRNNHLEISGGSALIADDGGNTMRLAGVSTLSGLDGADFIF